MTINLNRMNFEEVIANLEIPVLVDFWAAWCGPCRAIAPALEDISEQYADYITVAKLNVDESPEIAGKYGIRGIPALILFKDGKIVERSTGALPKEMIINFINKNLEWKLSA